MSIPQLPPLLTAGHLLQRNLHLLSLPANPSYTLSSTLFSHANPKAFHHILHHLLSPLPSLPLPYPRPLLSLLTAFSTALPLCYPATSPPEAREFLQHCHQVLLALEEWKERGVFPAGCVRKSTLQAGGGDKVTLLLLHLSSWRVREKVTELGGGGGGQWKGWDEKLGLEETLRALQLHTVHTTSQLVSEVRDMEEEQGEWKKAAEVMHEQWREVNARLKSVQEEEKRLRSTIDPFLLSVEAEEQRRVMSEALTAEYDKRSAFLQSSAQSRKALEEVVNRQWTPTVITQHELRSAMKESSTTSGQGESDRLELRQIMRRWKAELLQTRAELQAASSAARKDELMRAKEELVQSKADEAVLHARLTSLRRTVGDALTAPSTTSLSASSSSTPSPSSSNLPSSSSSFFTLYQQYRHKQPSRDDVSDDRPVTPIPSLSELSVSDSDDDEEGDQDDRGQEKPSTTEDEADDVHEAIQDERCSTSMPLFTPMKSSSARISAALSSPPPTPAYQVEDRGLLDGGLLDDSLSEQDG